MEKGQLTSDNYGRLEGTAFERGFVEKLKVAVVGVGALGNEAAKCLGLAGTGEVLLIDPDTVEASNLTRSVLFRDGVDAGENKAVAAARVAGRWFGETRWRAMECEVADVGWAELRECDLMIGAVDRDSARLEMARIGTRLGVPVCDGGMKTGGWGVRASWFPGGEGACFGCRLRGDVRREMLRTWSSAAYPCAGGEGGGGRASTPAQASVAGALVVELGLRWLRSGENEAWSVDFDLDAAPRAERIQVGASEECPFHETGGGEWRECAGRFEEMLRPGERASWEWAVCVRARCQRCGAEWAPRMRTARLRREGRCGACGAAEVLALEAVKEVRAGTDVARRRPEDLGLPGRHLYHIQQG
jgi:adenylyltransferase/sulfurtransferase